MRQGEKRIGKRGVYKYKGRVACLLRSPSLRNAASRLLKRCRLLACARASLSFPPFFSDITYIEERREERQLARARGPRKDRWRDTWHAYNTHGHARAHAYKPGREERKMCILCIYTHCLPLILLASCVLLFAHAAIYLPAVVCLLARHPMPRGEKEKARAAGSFRLNPVVIFPVAKVPSINPLLTIRLGGENYYRHTFMYKIFVSLVSTVFL